MKKITKISRNENAPATKADVREIITEMVSPIVTKVILEIVPPLVNEIVSREIEKLAIMIKHGFDDIEERMATKYDLNQFRREMGFLQEKNDERINDHETRIVRLEGAGA